MSSWHSFPSIYNLGHKAVENLLKGPVLVEEKVDGSQFSFGIFPDPNHPAVPDVVRVRSKGQEIHIDPNGKCSEKMFQPAVDTALELARLGKLRAGWTYRAEFLGKPKHNHLAYDRAPHKNIILFDINTDEETYMPYFAKAAEAAYLDLEVVPCLFSGIVQDISVLENLLGITSTLGGPKIEGIVVKPVQYDLFGMDRKVLMGKFVSEAFRESQKMAWKAANPNGGDIIQAIGKALNNEARWRKAVQNLRENGKLEGSPRDISSLFREVPADILKEEKDKIVKSLFEWAWPQILRVATAGVAEWYKRELLKGQAVASIEESSTGGNDAQEKGSGVAEKQCSGDSCQFTT